MENMVWSFVNQYLYVFTKLCTAGWSRYSTKHISNVPTTILSAAKYGFKITVIKDTPPVVLIK